MQHNPATFWIVTTAFAHEGFGSTGDPLVQFDDAVDAFIAARDDDQPATVFECCPAQGTMRDVTADAIERAEYFWRCNRVEAPAWAA